MNILMAVYLKFSIDILSNARKHPIQIFIFLQLSVETFFFYDLSVVILDTIHL